MTLPTRCGPGCLTADEAKAASARTGCVAAPCPHGMGWHITTRPTRRTR